VALGRTTVAVGTLARSDAGTQLREFGVGLRPEPWYVGRLCGGLVNSCTSYGPDAAGFAFQDGWPFVWYLRF